MTFNIGFGSDPDLAATFSGSQDTMRTSYGSVVERHSDDYDDLINKPQINAVEVIGSKVGADYHLQDKLTAGDHISIDGTTISSDLEYATYNEVITYLNS